MTDTHIIATQWLKAFNAHDPERLLSLYHEDAVHYSPKLKLRHPETMGLIRSKAALMAWWRDALDRLPSPHYQPLSLTADNSRVFMEYTRRVAGEPDMCVAEVPEVIDGLIIASRVYHG